MDQALIVHSPAAWVSRTLRNGRTVIFKAFRDRPLNGECPVWAMLTPANRQKLYSTEFS